MATCNEYLEGKNILITGFSGFLGKALLEKLIRFCPDIGNIYVILRTKKGATGEERLDNILKDVIFDRIKQQAYDKWRKKLAVLSGDISKLNLGLSEKDEEILIQNVNIVYHVAATVKFHEPLQKAILLNTRGTREMCKLVLKMKNLNLFVHTSTAYCNLDYKVLEEKIYPPLADWREAIEMAENIDDNLLNIIHMKYLGLYPNSYSYTKHLGEQVVNDMCNGKVPTLIIRPAIVVPSAWEPIPGWTDNLNGPVALTVGCAKGVVRMLYCAPDLLVWMVPVDETIKIFVSMTFVRGAKVPPEKKLELDVVNAFPTNIEHDTALSLRVKIFETLKIYALPGMIWYPDVKLTDSLLIFKLWVMVFHAIPGIIIDFILKILGRKPIVSALHRLFYTTSVSYGYYITRTWYFKNEKTAALDKYISNEECDDIVPYHPINKTRYTANASEFIHKRFLKQKPATSFTQNMIMKFLYQLVNFTTYAYLFYKFCLYTMAYLGIDKFI